MACYHARHLTAAAMLCAVAGCHAPPPAPIVGNCERPGGAILLVCHGRTGASPDDPPPPADKPYGRWDGVFAGREWMALPTPPRP